MAWLWQSIWRFLRQRRRGFYKGLADKDKGFDKSFLRRAESANHGSLSKESLHTPRRHILAQESRLCPSPGSLALVG